jgi:hypothetical protein
MKKFFYVAVMALALTACGNSEKSQKEVVATDYISDSVATAVVPAAATEVLPAASPGPDAGGKVATEVIPNE